MSGVWLRRVAFALLLGLLLVALVTARAVVEGEREMRGSDGAFHRGELRGAIVHARRAAVLYAPGAPHVTAAFARLEAIAVGSEARRDRETAETAWRAMRGAALETRHLWTPHAAELDRADRNLARLAAGASGPRPPSGHDALAELRRDEAPRAGWVALLVAGFALSGVGLAWIALVGVTADGRPSLARARWGVLLAVLGAACWTLAVQRA